MDIKQPLRILMTASTLPRWQNDSELRIVLDLAKNLQKYHPNLKITILAPHCSGAKKEEMLENVKIFRYRYFFAWGEKLCYNGGIMANFKKNKFLYFLIPFFLVSQILAIKKIVSHHKIDIIHAHWLIPQGLTAILYKKIFNKKIKIITTAHGIDVFGLNNRFFNNLKKIIIKNCDHLTAVSSAVKKELLKYSPCCTTVINNGINVNKQPILIPKHDIKNKYHIKSFLLLFIGRLVEKKGVNYLIDAMPKITKSFPDIKLLIVGDGPQKQNLQKQANKLDLNNIVFTGFISNSTIFSYYKAADIFIGPSVVATNLDSEGFGMVFIEAMLNKTPVIATHTGGITDIVKNKINGILIPPKNPEAISDKVITLLTNNKLRLKLVEEGQKTVIKNFNWKKISYMYYNTYINTINNYE